MSGTLVAYNASGDIIGTLDSMLDHDFAAREAAGEGNAGIWVVSGATGSAVWADRIERPCDFRVELAGPDGRERITALVNGSSGLRLAPVVPAGRPG